MKNRKLSSSARIAKDLVIRGTGTFVVEDYANIEDRVVMDMGYAGVIIIGSDVLPFFRPLIS